ncbi:NADPH:quinone reductase-like Zn-dependent oxidoreductase [Bradyrhizobium sp. LM2.7]
MPRVVRFHQHGGPEVLGIETVDVTPPGGGEVQIRVKALGLNRAEALLRSGTYIETAAFPSGLGLEAAGIVEAVGDGMAGFAPGDAVSVVPPVSMVRWPAYGELVTFPAELVVKHPPGLGFEAAAAVWMQYLTAYGALVDIAGLARGEVVVITAASSSVGLAAIQIANRIGAVPIAVTRTSAKRQALRDAGAADVVASAEEDIRSRLADVAGSNGPRVVFDAVGGPAFEPLTAVMAPGGILIEYAKPRADSISALQCPDQEPDTARLSCARDRPRSRSAREGEGVHPRWAVRRHIDADHCPNVSIRGDRRGASLSGIEHAVRQDRGNDLRSS